MTIPARIVAVKVLPAILSSRQQQFFLAELQSCLNVDRPRIVLDGSLLHKLDTSGIYLLVCCLEQAIQHNGDVKLAALPPSAEALLEFTGVSRIFDIYDTAVEAVNSFNTLPAELSSGQDQQEIAENAA